jgi:hypothetical protein
LELFERTEFDFSVQQIFSTDQREFPEMNSKETLTVGLPLPGACGVPSNGFRSQAYTDAGCPVITDTHDSAPALAVLSHLPAHSFSSFSVSVVPIPVSPNSTLGALALLVLGCPHLRVSGAELS